MARTRKQRESYERGCVILGTLMKQIDTVEKYQKEMRRYLLESRDWESVDKAYQEARYWGASESQLNQAKKAAYDSISDEDLLRAVCG